MLLLSSFCQPTPGLTPLSCLQYSAREKCQRSCDNEISFGPSSCSWYACCPASSRSRPGRMAAQWRRRPLRGRVAVSAAVTAKAYDNPVIPDATLADPTVIFVDDTYYLYATGDTRGYDVYTSNDLVHWKKGPRVFKASRPQAWAPDVYRHTADGKYYLYYTTDQKIGVAVSDRPDGQFVDQGLLVEEAIDAHLFADDDGKLYLFYVKFPGFRVHVQCMATPLEMQGDPHPVLEPSQAWEKTHGHVTEGPWMLKHAGRYYLVYSAAAGRPGLRRGLCRQRASDGSISKSMRGIRSFPGARRSSVLATAAWSASATAVSGTSTIRRSPTISAGRDSSAWTRCGLTSTGFSTAVSRGAG